LYLRHECPIDALLHLPVAALVLLDLLEQPLVLTLDLLLLPIVHTAHQVQDQLLLLMESLLKLENLRVGVCQFLLLLFFKLALL
jgi:hypothetical protein